MGITTRQDIFGRVLYPKSDDLNNLHAPKQNLTLKFKSFLGITTDVCVFSPDLEGYRIVGL